MGTHPIFESDFRLSNRVVWEMSFGDVSSAAGLEKLNAFLLDNSYAGGWVPTQVDVELFNAIKSSPDTYQNVLRWWNNIASYKSEFASLPAGSASAAPAAAEEEDDDDVDLFASDDEVDEEAEKIKAQRVAEYNARKEAKEAKKGKVIAKSNISSISNHGMMKPISKLWKRVLEVLLWMVSFGVLVNSSQSVMVSRNCRSPALLKTIKL